MMFQRFSDEARRVVVLAQEEARHAQHPHIGTEHLLLGVVSVPSLALTALESLGAPEPKVRSAVERLVGRGESTVTGHLPFTPRAKTVLELALREALRLGHDIITPSHLLLGLLVEGEGMAAQALRELVDDLDELRIQVIGRLGGEPPEGMAAALRELQVKRRAGASHPEATLLERALVGGAADDEVVKRLEAIEARLSSIERLLREGGASTG